MAYSGQRAVGRPGEIAGDLLHRADRSSATHSGRPGRDGRRPHGFEPQAPNGLERARLLARATLRLADRDCSAADGPRRGDDDLQDVVSRQLEALKASGGELFAFGSHFHDPAPKPGIDAEFGTKDGMHDIHMNRGNAPHEHDEDNGVFNDGGLTPTVSRSRRGAVLPLQDAVSAHRRERRLHPRRVEGDPSFRSARRPP